MGDLGVAEPRKGGPRSTLPEALSALVPRWAARRCVRIRLGVGEGSTRSGGAAGPRLVVVHCIWGEQAAPVPRTEDQHPVGDLDADGQRKRSVPQFADGVLSRSSWAWHPTTATTRSPLPARRAKTLGGQPASALVPEQIATGQGGVRWDEQARVGVLNVTRPGWACGEASSWPWLACPLVSGVSSVFAAYCGASRCGRAAAPGVFELLERVGGLGRDDRVLFSLTIRSRRASNRGAPHGPCADRPDCGHLELPTP
jgi:hypothetical protein